MDAQSSHVLTKKVAPTEIVERFLKQGTYSGVPSVEEEVSEQYRLELRKAQRQRREDCKKEEKEESSNKKQKAEAPT